ncbi:hypothetical protein [Roseateles amylovorans]|uniref:Uncharacterized protein n=1 Tax=Roseateles amylovorans TaxID=2978473 RepID=A0ABY6B2M5_9BURK|nr:hypothetical protein [Roseateles amylovorans]UXH79173.1 hypothetical protein N4261_04335 [Roseateles amylovorans]
MSLPVRHGALLQRVRLAIGAGAGAGLTGRAAIDPLRARQGLERALAGVDWSPSSLGPSALLFVRRLTVQGRRGPPRGDEPSGEFARQVSSAVSAQAAKAQRPWLRSDAAAAPAVCFADEAELSACLWRDWLHRTLDAGWWWHSVLGRQTPRQWLKAEVIDHGDRLVPTLSLLAARGLATAAVTRMDAAEVAAGLRALMASHAMPGIEARSNEALRRPGDQERGELQSPSGHATPSGLSDSRDRATPLTLRRLLQVVPELQRFTGDSMAGRLLAGALAVQREPAWARSSALLHALDHWAHTDAPPVTDRRGDPEADAEVHTTPPPRAGDGRSALRSVDSSDKRPSAVPPSPEAERTTSGLAMNESSTLTGHGAERGLARDPNALPDDDAPQRRSAGTLPDAQDTTPNAVAELLPTVCLTHYGGLFYLLNAALALRLYGDFTMPRDPGLRWSPWNLLAWTGQAWFGEAFTADPLWPLLADLAGRSPAEAPSRFFAEVPDWRLTDSDLAPWGAPTTLTFHATSRRLRVAHPMGFVITDVRRRTGMAPAAQARALCDAVPLLRRAVLRRAVIASANGTAAHRWLSHWRRYLEARLRAALGVRPTEDLAACVCRHRAEVSVGMARVDVVLSLADLPLSIRIAGLDRDPGWIPATGRSVMFHFE